MSWIRPLPLVLAAVGLIVVATVAAQAAFANRIFPGVSAVGMDLGGQTVAQASARVQPRLDAYAGQPIAVRAGNLQLRLMPSDLGFRPRATALAQASFTQGREGPVLFRLADPLLARWAPSPLAADWDLDDATLASAVQRIASQVDRPATDARLAIDPELTVQPAQPGRSLDQARVRAVVEDYLGNLRTGPLVLPVAVVPPRVTTAQLTPLRARAQTILGETIELTDGSRRWTVPPATLHAALLYQTDPPSLGVAPAAFAPLLQTIAGQLDRPARDATVKISNGKVSVVPDQTGQTVDRAATAAALGKALLAGDHSVPVVLKSTPPATRAADLRAVATQTQKLLDQGLTLTAGSVSTHLDAAALGNLVKVEHPEGGGWEASLDSAKLQPVIAKIAANYLRPSVGTRFTWDNGQVAFLGSSRAGWMVDQSAASKAVLAHWRDGKVALPVVESPNALNDAYLARLKPDLQGVIGDRATTFAGSIPERAHNVSLAAQRLNGALVVPGATFSFNQTIGPTTLAAGFQWGFAFATNSAGQSRTVPSVAGGLCQVASTVFQPVFWAGYEIDERHPHLFWIKNYEDRGYVGLDTTVAPEAGVDFKFTNDTSHALLIQAWTDSDQLMHVRLIGTRPDWRVQVSPEKISNVIPAPTQVLHTTSPLFAAGRVIDLEDAQTGLTSHVTRQVIYPDGHVRTLHLTSVYQPAHAAVLEGTGCDRFL